MARPTCREGTFYLDVPIDPPEAIPFVGNGRSARYRRTLGTKDPAEAKVRFAKRYAELHAEWKRLAAGAAPLSEARVKVLAGTYYRQLSERLASGPNGGTPETWLAIIDHAKVFAQTSEGLEAEYGGEADRLLQEAALLADTSSRIRLLEELHRMWVLLAEAQTRRLKADFGPDPALALYDAAASAPASASGVVKLTHLFALWEKDVLAEGKRPRTVRDFRHKLDSLIAFLGHDDAARISTKNISDWRDHVWHELGLDKNTVDQKYMAAAKAVFRKGIEKSEITFDPTTPFKAKRVKKPPLRAKGYDNAEALRILMASRNIDAMPSRMAEKNKLACHWVPWICAFTGARCGEITQLRREDLLEIDGIACIRITPEAGTVKAGGFRINPLHPQLIELGLVTFIKSRPEGYLFAELRKASRADGLPSTSAGVVGKVSGWVRDHVGITDPLVQPNHAWRHRFKTISQTSGLDLHYVNVIQGHADGRAASDYGETEVAALHREIEKLPCVDIEKGVWVPHAKTTDAP